MVIEETEMSSGTDTLIARRKALRQLVVAQRMEQKKEVIAMWSQEIHVHLKKAFPKPPGSVIGFYWPMRNEPDLRQLMECWYGQGVVVALPVVVERNACLVFSAWHPGDVILTDAQGIPTPSGNDYVVPDALIVPLNAFDEGGFRLGYGGGYFDRTLASLRPQPLSIGVGFEIGRVPTVWPQPHDVRMDCVVTEAGMVRVSNDKQCHQS